MRRGDELVVRWNPALLRWQVFRIGSDVPRLDFDTKTAAMRAALGRGRKTGETIAVFTKDGRLESRRSFPLV